MKPGSGRMTVADPAPNDPTRPASSAPGHAPAVQSKPTARQIAVIFAILMAGAMTGYYTRLIQTGLADLAGIWGLSADQAAILKTTAVAPQMLIAPVIPWLVTVFGFRPVLLPAALAFIFVSFITPFLTGYIPLLAAHGLMGALLGCFITATIMIMTRTIPGQWWIIPLGFYVFRMSLTINTGVSMSALYVEYFGFQWIYWQSTIIMIIYITVLFICIPPTNVLTSFLKKLDISGMLLLCLGTVSIYVGVDQGERLGWLDSGFITVCLGGGMALLVAFCINELLVPYPFAPLEPFLDRGVFMTLAQGCLFCFMFMGNVALIMQFLASVHSLKGLQTGQVLLLIAGTQLLLIPMTIWLIRHVDSRLVHGIGLVCYALACHRGSMVTADWMAADFIPTGILFAFANPLTFLSILASGISIFGKERSVGLLPYIQVLRLLIPAIATAVVTVYIRVRTDMHTVFVGQLAMAQDRLIHRFVEGLDSQGNIAGLADMIHTQAVVLAYQDTFHFCFWAAMAGLALLVLAKPTPYTPLTPVVIGRPAKV